MNIYDYDLCLFGESLQYLIHGPEGAIYWLHEYPPQEVYYPYGDTRVALYHRPAFTQGHWRIVSRSEYPRFCLQELCNLFLFPYVVSCGYYVQATGEELFGHLRGDSRTSRGVFSICYDKVYAFFLSEGRQLFFQNLPSWSANDVSQDEGLKYHIGALRFLERSPQVNLFRRSSSA